MAEPKHKKMYANSPTLETDESGKKYIKKNSPNAAEKKTSEVNSGTDGMQITEQGPMYERHMKEISDMSDRHLAERKDITKRHMSEMKKNTPSDEVDTGEEQIKKIKKEGDK